MPLKIIVVGAGIGGLGAAIALTRAGHYVEVFEKSSFHNETGAAIGVAPNATRILKQWGCDLEAMKPVACEYFKIWDKEANFVETRAVVKDIQQQLGFQGDWLLIHRVDLHNGLRKTAEAGFAGRKPQIHLGCSVTSVDPIAGRVTLQDGRVSQADVVIGADGVHSDTTTLVAGGPQKKISTGQNCYRFVVPMQKIESNPLTKALVEKTGLDAAHAFGTQTERIVMYPCRSGALMNCAVFVPTSEDEDFEESSWLNPGKQKDLMAAVQRYGPELRELCSLSEGVKFWSLASRNPPRAFYKGILALVGDAAHPMLPHQGQGGAQAFEDAATLGALFTADTRPEQVSDRLRLYNDIRYNRAVTIMFMSRVGDQLRQTVIDDLKEFVPNAKMPENMFHFAWSSDPIKIAESALVNACGS